MGLCALATGAALTGCEDRRLGRHTVTIGQDPARVGEPVDFVARAESFDDRRRGGNEPVDPGLVVFNWDLDGDGVVKTSSPTEAIEPDPTTGVAFGFSSRLARAYDQPQTIEISSLVGLSAEGGILVARYYGDSSLVKRTLVVEPAAGDPGGGPSPPPGNQPPLASFTAVPNPAEPHEEIQLDASGSQDPDGSITKYEWNIDDLGAYDRTETDPHTSVFYDNSGTYRVTLRVTDNSGGTATTTRDIVVRFDPRIDRFARRAPEMPRFEVAPSGRPVNEGTLLIDGDEVILNRAKSRGTLPADPFPKPLRGSHDVRWAADYVVNYNPGADSMSAEAFVLLTFATGGRACLGTTVEGRPGEDPQGRFRVLGAIGRAARLRGLGTATGRIDATGRPLITGRGRFRLGEEQRFGLGKSRCGKLRRLAPQRG